MKRDIGFTKIRRRVIARAINEEAGVGLRGKAGIQEAEKAIGCQGKERFESHTQASAVINRKRASGTIAGRSTPARPAAGSMSAGSTARPS